MTNSNQDTKIEKRFNVNYKSPQNFVFILLALTSIILIILAVNKKFTFGQNDYNEIVTGIAIAFGPATLLGYLFRIFLLDDVKNELMEPLVKLEETTADAIKMNIEEKFVPIMQKVEMLTNFEKHGVLWVYRTRQEALIKDGNFYNYLEKEEKKIEIIGSSLQGLMVNESYEHVKELLITKKDKLRIILTHPCVADLRAGQENREDGDIPNEIISTLELLKNIGVDPNKVFLYRGTPTCFAIKTNDAMLLNPYPYTNQAMDSPCFILKAGYMIYQAFSGGHFSAYNTKYSVKVKDFESTIKVLKDEMIGYSNKAKCVLGKLNVKECVLNTN